MNKNLIVKVFLILSLFSGLFFTNDTFSSWKIDSPDFTVDLTSITPIGKGNFEWTTLTSKTNDLLGQVINTLMVAIWVISLLVISVWAGYMIFYNWKEDFLTKWRSMIFTGFLALFIALSSFYIINLIRYILYSWQ